MVSTGFNSYSRFQVPTGSLGTYPSWIRESNCTRLSNVPTIKQLVNDGAPGLPLRWVQLRTHPLSSILWIQQMGTYEKHISPFLFFPSHLLFSLGPDSSLFPLLPAILIAIASLLSQCQSYHQQLVLGQRQEKTSRSTVARKKEREKTWILHRGASRQESGMEAICSQRHI